MAGTIITVAQQKGGAGKTTLVAHLAVAFAQGGRKVATVDIDPQGSLSQWFELRKAALANPGLTHAQITGWRTAGEVDRLAREHEIVVIDSPPHAETEARLAVRAARLVVVPLQPSPMDFWATGATLALAAAERVPAMLVLNRVPARANLAIELMAKIAEFGVAVAEAQLGGRIGFAEALMAGRTVTETAQGSRSAEEVDALAAEILRRSK